MMIPAVWDPDQQAIIPNTTAVIPTAGSSQAQTKKENIKIKIIARII